MKQKHVPAGLPVELTRFIGRGDELAALRGLLGGTRLLTLTGAGGSGKSRLALELAADLARSASDGVVWVELAPLADAELLPAHVLAALGDGSEGAASDRSVIESIGDRHVALVLDNCEHLVEACAVLVTALLRSCPNLRILATSREALAVPGERAWLVPALRLPATDATLDVMRESDAVRLFVDRATDVLGEFTLTTANAPAIAAICAQLDGIPLAIELAAARMRHMSADEIRDRLVDLFALLTTGSRTALPRHRTLRAALDWSHDLLQEDARVVFRRLAVFRGGFPLDGAEFVAAGHGIAAADVLDLVGTLVDRSMIVVREHHGRARYQMLEPLRQYALQKLTESGEAQRVEQRFADGVANLVALHQYAFITTERRTAFAILEPELDNIREALAWTRAHDHVQHVRLVGTLWWFWFSTRHWVEANQWLTDALRLEAAAGPSHERATLLFAAGALASLRGEAGAAQPLLEEAAALAGRFGDDRLEAYALNYLGMVHAQQSRPEAREYSGRAEKWFRAHGDLYGLRLALLLIGIGERAAGNRDEALRLTREAVDIARRFGQDRELAIALQNLAVLLFDAGLHEAEPVTLESLAALRRDPAWLFIYRGIEQLALITAQRDPSEAAVQLGAADAIRRHIGAKRFGFDQQRIAELETSLRGSLGAAAFDAAYAEGLRLPPTDALDVVLARLESAGGAAGDSTTPASAPPASASAGQTARVAVDVSDADPRDRADIDAGSAAAVDLRVRSLGPFAVDVRGARIDAWPFSKPRELLLYLLAHPQGRTRGDIGQAIWPDATSSQVRNSFHVALHHLRKALGQPGWIVLENERYRISPDITVDWDVTAFERDAKEGLAAAARAADPDDVAATERASRLLERALAHYRDHFLAGETAGPWRDDLQDRLRRLFCDAGIALGRTLMRAGRTDESVRAFEGVVSTEPLHEEAHRGLLAAWLGSGNRAHAIRHYERLAATLREVLDAEPEPETVELFERIRTGQPA